MTIIESEKRKGSNSVEDLDNDDGYYDEEAAKDALIDAALRGDVPITKTKSPSEVDNSLTVIPVMRRRSVEATERHKRQQFPGWDKDMENLVKKGYTIKDSYEYVGDTSKTYDRKDSDMIGTYHNRRSGPSWRYY